MARAKGGGGSRPPQGGRDLQSTTEQANQIKGFRLTGTSAIELVVTAGLYTMSLVFVLLAFTGWRYGSLIAEAGRTQVLHRLDQAPAASAVAAGSYGGDLTVQVVRFCAAIDAGDMPAAAEAVDRMQAMAPSDPDTSLSRAVLLLTDPSSAALPASRTEAEALLKEAGLRPEAQAALGQLALDRGDYATAQRAFKTVFEMSDALPSDAACAIAYNGLGICRIQSAREALTPDDVKQAIDDFRRAMAYRRPWAPPMVNRDRAAAMWLRLKLRELDRSLRTNPAAHRAAVQAAVDAFNTQLGFAEAEQRDVINIGPRGFSSDVQWPSTKSLTVPVTDGRVPVELGRIPAEPMIANRRAYLKNALGMAASRLIDSDGLSGSVRAAFNTVRTEFEEAAGTDGRFAAAQFNKVVCGLRMFQSGKSLGDRQVAMGGDMPRLLRDLCDHVEDLPEIQRAPLLTAFYVVIGEVPDKFVDGRISEGSAMLGLVERMKLLDRIEAQGGLRAPTADWLDFQRQHLATVSEALKPGSTSTPVASLNLALPWAERLAAWLPVETAPEQAAHLNNPAGIGKGPLPDRKATWAEVGMIVRLYEDALRDLANALMVKVQSLPAGDESRLDLLFLAKRTETCRLRLCGMLAAEQSWCLGRVPEADRVRDNNVVLLQRIEVEITK